MVRLKRLYWSRSVLDKIERKHHVQISEVEEALFSRGVHIRKAAGVYHAYGRSATGRYLFIVFRESRTYSARIITARDMSGNEKRQYRKARSGERGSS